MKTLFAVALGLALAACDAADSGPAFRSTPVDAEFRWLARDMYGSLLMPSCSAPSGFRRADRLRREQAAVEAFERRLEATPPGSHLAIARSDEAHDRALAHDCWSDEDLRFAEIHVGMTEETVANALRRMEALLPSLRQAVPAGGVADGPAAEFRRSARELVRSSRPRCRLTSAGDNDEIAAPARAEVARFQARLAGTPYAAHYAIAEADVAHEHSISVVECADPGASAPDAAGSRLLADVRRRIAALEATLGGSALRP